MRPTEKHNPDLHISGKPRSPSTRRRKVGAYKHSGCLKRGGGAHKWFPVVVVRPRPKCLPANKDMVRDSTSLVQENTISRILSKGNIPENMAPLALAKSLKQVSQQHLRALPNPPLSGLKQKLKKKMRVPHMFPDRPPSTPPPPPKQASLWPSPPTPPHTHPHPPSRTPRGRFAFFLSARVALTAGPCRGAAAPSPASAPAGSRRPPAAAPGYPDGLGTIGLGPSQRKAGVPGDFPY